MPKRERELRRLAARYGLIVELSNSSHWLLRHPGGRLISTVPRTPGAVGYLRQAQGDIRRGLRHLNPPPPLSGA